MCKAPPPVDRVLILCQVFSSIPRGAYELSTPSHRTPVLHHRTTAIASIIVLINYSAWLPSTLDMLSDSLVENKHSLAVQRDCHRTRQKLGSY